MITLKIDTLNNINYKNIVLKVPVNKLVSQSRLSVKILFGIVRKCLVQNNNGSSLLLTIDL